MKNTSVKLSTLMASLLVSAGVDTQKDVTVGAGYMYQW